MAIGKKEKERFGKKGKEVKALADYICNALAGKMIIHRYDCFQYEQRSTFKFDYGVANSLRISDHAGYGYLSYRYNITLGLKKAYKETSRQFVKEFYPEAMVDDVVDRIVAMREEKNPKDTVTMTPLLSRGDYVRYYQKLLAKLP